MKQGNEQSASDWFQAAVVCYVAEHQGCPYCAGQHCVFRSFWGKRIEYYCSRCDFSACMDTETGAFQVTAGKIEQIVANVLDANDA